MSQLSHHFRVRRRYMRSVNLERDSAQPESLDGYIVTARARETLNRICESLCTDGVPRAWTLTGVYGTGKSAFANLLAALCAHGGLRERAFGLLEEQGVDPELIARLSGAIPPAGFVRAMAVGRREPLQHTVLRGLGRGVQEFWEHRPGPKPQVVNRVLKLCRELDKGERPDVSNILEMVIGVAEASGAGVLIMIDELGKLLEHAAWTGAGEDLFLLQQLAELPTGADSPPVLVVGLLHQSFSEYGDLLSTRERAEWEKVHGRFEDVPFAESSIHLLGLMSAAIEADPPKALRAAIQRDAEAWCSSHIAALDHPYFAEMLPAERVAALYPLHPAAALVLPTLCMRYGQNDRSIFTFLGSGEAHGLASFLEEHAAAEDDLPLLRVGDVYDYFIGAGRGGSAGRVQSHRWAEIQSRIRDAYGLEPEELEALKVIGTLNLLASTGPLRASRELVLTALAFRPADAKQRAHWTKVLDVLASRRVITYRKQVDEFRVWAGSDFDIDGAIESHREADRRSLAELLTELAPLPPMVAQRHSYQTGTLRVFDRLYVDDRVALGALGRDRIRGDGATVYWLGEDDQVPDLASTDDGVPLVIVAAKVSPALHTAALEVGALVSLQNREVALQTDGVALGEVRQRLVLARELLDGLIRETYAGHASTTVLYGGAERGSEGFNAGLSDLCDRVFTKGPILWNELINRRELTSQGARAQRELIAAILTNPTVERLGIEGNGPEYCMYASVLANTGIHRVENGGWLISRPEDSGVQPLWDAIEEFCLSAVDKPRSLSDLYALLEAPPYGTKRGLIPVLLAAVLVHHADNVAAYREGSFLPILRPSHFELIVKHPSEFYVKHLELKGIRWELFRELEAVLTERGAKRPLKGRNATLLTVVRPLVRFAASLPKVTLEAEDISEEAKAVRDALLTTPEPDLLVFDSLPRAVGQQPFGPRAKKVGRRHEEFRGRLFDALRELQTHYDELLHRCQELAHEAFGVRADLSRLREDLRVRASYLVGGVIEPRLRAFVIAAADEGVSDREWIESIAMIVSDRPAENWGKDGLFSFEASLPEFARRFANLESLQREATREGLEGFDARRVTITRPDGGEVHRLVWVDRQSRSLIDAHADRLFQEIDEITDPNHRHAVLLTMFERVLGGETRPADLAQQPEAKAEKHA